MKFRDSTLKIKCFIKPERYGLRNFRIDRQQYTRKYSIEQIIGLPRRRRHIVFERQYTYILQSTAIIIITIITVVTHSK